MAEPAAQRNPQPDRQPWPHRPADPYPAPAQGAARAEARARITPEVNPTINHHPQPSAGTERDAATDFSARFIAWATPPDPRYELPPTWQQIVWRGVGGDHAPPAGWPHKLSVAWAYGVTLPVRVLVIYLDWLARAPSRAGVAALIYVLLVHVPWLSWLPWPDWLP